MYTVKDVCDALFELAPADEKMDIDNVGLLAGDSLRKVDSILGSLDITSEVIKEAVDTGVDLIVSHHPLLFSEKSITDTTLTGKLILSLLSNKISAICMHTNLDAARGGVNDALARACGLSGVQILCDEGHYSDGTAYSYGRIGRLDPEVPLRDYLSMLKSALKTKGLRYHNSGKAVSKVAVVGGSGGSYLERAFGLGCDTLVTADVKYDVFLAAREIGI
ncbi:MAG: Nif3-like dinuclear metal center hexameric protein, partial [Clostridiales bacterium]|nr:Nif3-like dinuclear metal center hexameric protein [Clostridiales bacterium]